VLVNVFLRRLLRVLDRMQLVAVRELGVMACLLVLARFRVRGGPAMVLGCVLVVLRGLMVMIVDVVLFHGVLLEKWCCAAPERALSLWTGQMTV
jgi:hypothetical protein